MVCETVTSDISALESQVSDAKPGDFLLIVAEEYHVFGRLADHLSPAGESQYTLGLYFTMTERVGPKTWIPTGYGCEGTKAFHALTPDNKRLYLGDAILPAMQAYGNHCESLVKHLIETAYKM